MSVGSSALSDAKLKRTPSPAADLALSCPDCDSFVPQSPRLARCVKCGLVRTVGATTPTNKQDYLHVDDAQRQSRRAYFEALVDRYVNGAPGLSLDVGCATGELVDVLNARGWQAQGIDSYEGFHANDRRFIRAELGDFETQRKYHLITLVHCLEHICDPAAALAKARSLLTVGGRLLIVVPHIDGAWARLLGERWHMLDPDHHVFHYSLEGLGNVVRRAGLRPLRINTYSGHAVSPFEIRLSERGFYSQGIASIWPLRSLIFHGLSALRPFVRWSLDRRRRGDEIQLLAAASDE